MDKAKAERILLAGKERQADFVEIFEEETRNAYVSFKDGKVESASAGTDYGIGLRMLYGSQVLYAHSSNEDEAHLIRLLDELAKSRGITSSQQGVPAVHLVGKVLENRHKISLDPRVVGQAKKLDMLKTADRTARDYSEKVVQVAVRAADSVTHVLICNSDGLWVEDDRFRSRFSVQVTAEANGERFTASESPGALQGFEFFEGLNIPTYAKMAAERAVLMLSAGYVEGRQMPVIMGNGFGGVIFHEACGHPLETESIRRNASPFVDKLGTKIAHEAVTAVDDGTITNLWGSLNVDDEGMEAERTVLIENGILKNYMSDKVGGGEINVNRTGSARRESYQYSPVSRMRNTFIDKGKDSCSKGFRNEADDALARNPLGMELTGHAARRLGGPPGVGQVAVREHRRPGTALLGDDDLVAELLVHPNHRLPDLGSVVVRVTAVEVGDLLVGVDGLAAALAVGPGAFPGPRGPSLRFPPLAEGLGGELGELPFRGDAHGLLHDPAGRTEVHREVREGGDLAGEPRGGPVVREDPVAPVLDRRLRHPLVDVLAAGGVVHLRKRHVGRTGRVTAHAVRARRDGLVDVVVALALEPPLLGPLELRPGEVVVHLRDRTGRVAGGALVAVVRAGAEVHPALEDVDRCVELGINTVFFQVVFHGTAAYESERLPWTHLISGFPGRSQGWDPLAFTIEEAHERGLELHTWFNVFQVGNTNTRVDEASEPQHVRFSHPEWVKQVGNDFWVDPGLPAVRESLVGHVVEIVEN